MPIDDFCAFYFCEIFYHEMRDTRRNKAPGDYHAANQRRPLGISLDGTDIITSARAEDKIHFFLYKRLRNCFCHYTDTGLQRPALRRRSTTGCISLCLPGVRCAARRHCAQAVAQHRRRMPAGGMLPGRAQDAARFILRKFAMRFPMIGMMA